MRDHATDLPLFSWSPPSAHVVPFPNLRRKGYVQKIADMLLGSSRIDKREKRLARHIEQMRKAYVRKGVDPDVAERELASLERALRVLVLPQTIGDVDTQ